MMTMNGEIVESAPEYVESVLATACERDASDIYWLPGPEGVAVRFRVNGIHVEHGTVPGEIGEQCLTRLKVLAGLLTYRTRVAQDGVIRYAYGNEIVEIRIATMPTIHGERMTLRLPGGERRPEHLAELKLGEASEAAIRRILARPSGLCILTGPTGCGKTTTMYAMVRELIIQNQEPASIITLEDPVECQIAGISQSNISSGDGDWGYDVALRAALRQDVKTLMVGEMRDRNVVKVVLDAALTGHRVITTYHAGDIASVYARMLHQGFEPFLVASAVTGVIAQRLVAGSHGGRVVVSAVLEADDYWREFLCGAPGLDAIRARIIAERPDADLGAAARALAEDGVIRRETAALVEL